MVGHGTGVQVGATPWDENASNCPYAVGEVLLCIVDQGDLYHGQAHSGLT